MRDARRRTEGRRGLLIWLALLLVVAAVVVVLVRRGDADRVVFSEPDGGSATRGGEGLMDGRRALRPVVQTRRPFDDAYLVALVGPGSVVLRPAELELDRDADPMWIRQVGTSTDVPVEEEVGIRWHGWVATQPRDYANLDGPPDLRWRSAAGRGVLVRPGTIVRLRTRYDVPRSSARVCTDHVLAGGREWQVRRDGGGPRDWRTLRMRDEATDGETEEVVVRTGQVGPLAFRVGGKGCRTGGSTGESLPDDG